MVTLGNALHGGVNHASPRSKILDDIANSDILVKLQPLIEVRVAQHQVRNYGRQPGYSPAGDWPMITWLAMFER